MRAIILATLIFLSFNVRAEKFILATCNATLRLNEVGKTLAVAIYKDGKAIMGEINEGTTKAVRPVSMHILNVRPNLRITFVTEDMNVAERLIVHAKSIEADPVTGAQLSTGVDLDAIRSATVYVIDPQPDQISLNALVIGRDAKGRELGSFIGGFFIAPCK